MKKFLTALFLPIYVFIVRAILLLLIYLGIKAGVAWFIFCFSEILLIVSALAATFYSLILEKVNNSFGVSLYSAIISTIFCVLAILGSLANASDTPPAFLAFSIIIDIVISIYVIYQANKSKVLCKSN